MSGSADEDTFRFIADLPPWRHSWGPLSFRTYPHVRGPPLFIVLLIIPT